MMIIMNGLRKNDVFPNTCILSAATKKSERYRIDIDVSSILSWMLL